MLKTPFFEVILLFFASARGADGGVLFVFYSFQKIVRVQSEPRIGFFV